MNRSWTRAAWFVVLVALAAMALVGCGNTGGDSTTGSSAGGGSSSAKQPASAPDFKALLTAEDAKRISGQSDITEADLGIRQGSSEYLVIYTAKKFPEGLWLRVGNKGMFEEARSAYGQGKETSVDGLGDKAFSWDSKDSDAGVAFLKDGRTYIISTEYWVPDQTTMVMQPGATAEQLMDAAKTVNDRL